MTTTTVPLTVLRLYLKEAKGIRGLSKMKKDELLTHLTPEDLILVEVMHGQTKETRKLQHHPRKRRSSVGSEEEEPPTVKGPPSVRIMWKGDDGEEKFGIVVEELRLFYRVTPVDVQRDADTGERTVYWYLRNKQCLNVAKSTSSLRFLPAT